MRILGSALTSGRRHPRAWTVGVGLFSALLFLALGHQLRAVEPLKVGGLPVT